MVLLWCVVDESPIESTNSLVKEEIDLAVDELYYIRASDDSGT